MNLTTRTFLEQAGVFRTLIRRDRTLTAPILRHAMQLAIDLAMHKLREFSPHSIWKNIIQLLIFEETVNNDLRCV
jgi:hypothetical protein